MAKKLFTIGQAAEQVGTTREFVKGVITALQFETYKIPGAGLGMAKGLTQEQVNAIQRVFKMRGKVKPRRREPAHATS